MTATQAMTGQGGWPMTVFLTPDGDPIYAGTYFPRSPLGGMPSFGQVLDAVAGAWAERSDEVRQGAAEISRRLADSGAGDIADDITTEGVGQAVAALSGEYDNVNHGFGRAPKFPPSMVIEALLRIADDWPNAPRQSGWRTEP
jgi:uncharacterized protein